MPKDLHSLCLSVCLCAITNFALGAYSSTSCTIGHTYVSAKGIKFLCYQQGTFHGYKPTACVHGGEHQPNAEWVTAGFRYHCYYEPNAADTLAFKTTKCVLPDGTELADGGGRSPYACAWDSAAGALVLTSGGIAATCAYGGRSYGGGAKVLVADDARVTQPPQIGMQMKCQVSTVAGAKLLPYMCALGAGGTVSQRIYANATEVYSGDGKTYRCALVGAGGAGDVDLYAIEAAAGGCADRHGGAHPVNTKWNDAASMQRYWCRALRSNGQVFIEVWGCLYKDAYGSTKQLQKGLAVAVSGQWYQCWKNPNGVVVETLRTKESLAMRRITDAAGASHCVELNGTRVELGAGYNYGVTLTSCAADQYTGAAVLLRRSYCTYCGVSYASDKTVRQCTKGPHAGKHFKCYRKNEADPHSLMEVYVMTDAEYARFVAGGYRWTGTGGSGSGSGGTISTTTTSTTPTTTTPTTTTTTTTTPTTTTTTTTPTTTTTTPTTTTPTTTTTTPTTTTTTTPTTTTTTTPTTTTTTTTTTTPITTTTTPTTTTTTPTTTTIVSTTNPTLMTTTTTPPPTTKVPTTTGTSTTAANTASTTAHPVKCYTLPAGQPTADHFAASGSCALPAFATLSDFDRLVADSQQWGVGKMWIDGRMEICGGETTDPTTDYVMKQVNSTVIKCLAFDSVQKALVLEQCGQNLHYACESTCPM